MERTRILKQNKNQSCQADGYFHKVTLASRIMRNTANFYIRNTMTGIKKSPEERTNNETEVLHYVLRRMGTNCMKGEGQNRPIKRRSFRPN